MVQSKGSVEAHMHDIQKHSFEFHDIVAGVRSLFLKTCPDLSEAVKYGGIVFLKDRELTGGIFVYKEHVSVEFSHGASFHDPDAILEGKGKYRRHIKLRGGLEEVSEKRVTVMIAQACP
ncbi:DUF1801 domain-containing protein [Prosthecochloris sp.]|uniref:DUF1801 domain-containing protein n=1 Tax=Prosthecochloris sp. TaxID=290513 RepID=UPI0025D39841|nr:DUF1801 domain-containing protein [Prosthecochloris sp.]